MAPQFVDFNADGHMDIVTATFDGSPWISYGSEKGFQQPSHISDKNGRRIILSYYYSWKDPENKGYKTENHLGDLKIRAHCISAMVHDWDADGDLDLVMGDRNGRLWLQLNEGEAGKPAFSGTSSLIKVEDKPFNAGDKMTNAKMVDWDGDGLTDIVFGTFGDPYPNKKGGTVKWVKNVGKEGKPEFSEPKVLIEGSSEVAKTATRPDSGLYIDIVDYDNDGDLDILVGGYSLYKKTDAELEKEKEGRKGQRRVMAEHRKPYVWIYLQKAKESESKKKPETDKDDPEEEEFSVR